MIVDSELASVSGKGVDVKGIGKTFGEVTAVGSVTLKIQPGEFISLLGPSGSGKTTLLMMIAGFETPTSGSISIGDTDVTHTPANKRGVGMVFQKYALFPHMTVAENIAFPLKMRKFERRAIDQRVDEALELVRLGGLNARTPSQLSGGQQQRVAVARALVFQPQVLLMDEPLGALDKKLREEMQIEIKSIQERLGVTVIYVTHDQEEALTMSDRVAVMNDGDIVQLGTPRELYDKPMSTFVADFVGRTNLLNATVKRSDSGQPCLDFGGGECVSAESARLDRIALNGTDVSVRIAVRPEDIEVLPLGRSAEPTIKGVVQASVFLGSHLLVVLDLPDAGGAQIQAQVPVTAHDDLKRGDKVDIRLDPTRINAFMAKGT
ncbi:MAG: ABC transporter ATP-binding protein [Alphaproteobacteria bacterium]